MFLDRVERLPVTSRSHVTDITDVTDKCKISIMILTQSSTFTVAAVMVSLLQCLCSESELK